GPSPPLLSGAPLLPPPSYLATPSGIAQSSFPLFASNATQTSCWALSTVRNTCVNALPSPTVMALKPSFKGTFHNARNPLCGQVFTICSAQVPSWFGPRNCVQSAANAVTPRESAT